MLNFVSEYLKQKDVDFSEHQNMAELSSMKAGGTARFYALPKTAEQLCETVVFAVQNAVPYKIVGSQTNILFKDGEYNGIVVSTRRLRKKKRAENRIAADCGAKFSSLVAFMASQGYGGAEPLAHIPGTVGGMVYSNAGAYGMEIADLFLWAEVLSPADMSVKRLTKEKMRFSYRSSRLRDDGVLLTACFEFKEREKEEIRADLNKYASFRAGSQPIEQPSLGSIFRRYEGVGAGYYIERAGLKGFCIGDAVVSEKHAGFIVNRGRADADDVIRLIDWIKERVLCTFGIELIEEVEII